MSNPIILCNFAILIVEPVHEAGDIFLVLLPSQFQHLQVLQPVYDVTRDALVTFVHLSEALRKLRLVGCPWQMGTVNRVHTAGLNGRLVDKAYCQLSVGDIHLETPESVTR